MKLAKVKSIGYWAATAILSLQFLVGGVVTLARPPEVLAGMEHLGYPVYFGLILGVWKVLGAAALLAPRFPRLKEWAYAGIFFDLTGAVVSHAASGDGAKALGPVVFLALAIASWALRPSSRVIGTLARAPARGPKPDLAVREPLPAE
jgi:uncharacterized membrane protein YphA (DoxX/SURF4 family)